MSINIGKEWRFMDKTEEKITNLLESWDFAEKHHKGQMYGSKPYKFHLKNVYNLVLVERSFYCNRVINNFEHLGNQQPN